MEWTVLRAELVQMTLQLLIPAVKILLSILLLAYVTWDSMEMEFKAAHHAGSALSLQLK